MRALKPKPLGWKKNDPCLSPVPDAYPEFDRTGAAMVREYRDAEGKLLLHQVRYFRYDKTGKPIIGAKGTPEKDDRYFVLKRAGSGELYWSEYWHNLAKPRPLYRGQFLPLNPNAPVMICEGEKAAEAAAELFINHVSIAWVGGSSSAKHADWKQLAGRNVTIFRDHDEPGYKAAKEIAKALENSAQHVYVLNLEALAKHLGHPLKKSYDADDLRNVDGWDHESMARFLANPEALLPGSDLTGDDKAAGHRALVDSLEQHLEREGITMNAAEQWCSTADFRPLPRTSIVTLAHSFAFEYRYEARVASTMVTETLSELGREAAKQRRNRLIEHITGRDTDPAGLAELVKFVHAVTGRDDVVVLHGLRHWIWLVKRTLCGMPRAWDLMPILYGRQRGGKSTAAAKLCAPLQELVSAIQSNILTDDRAAPILGRFYVGIWDELEGIGRAETEAIKNAITCTTKMHRVLGSHESGTVVRVMNFIGTSNKPIGEVMRDTTGLGRFMQVECRDVLDWSMLNAIDYDLLWRCVSEHDEPPIRLVAEDLAKEQEAARHKDSISYWLEGETWERLVWEPIAGGGVVTVPEYNPKLGDLPEEIDFRYTHWCRRHSEPMVRGNLWWRRLEAEGVTTWRPRVNGAVGPRRYRRPENKREP